MKKLGKNKQPKKIIKNSKKQLQRNGLFPMLQFMRKLRKVTIILAIAFVANVFVIEAHADETKVSMFDTALSATSISSGNIICYDLGDYLSDPVLPTGDVVFAPSTFSSAFSPSPVPEPSTIGLFAMGIFALVIFAKSKRPSLSANQQAGEA